MAADDEEARRAKRGLNDGRRLGGPKHRTVAMRRGRTGGAKPQGRAVTLEDLQEEKRHRRWQNRIQWVAIIIAALVGVYGVQTSRQESDQLQAAQRDEQRVTCYEAYGMAGVAILSAAVTVDESEDGVGMSTFTAVIEKAVIATARCTEARLTIVEAREELAAAMNSVMDSASAGKERQSAALTDFSNALAGYIPIRLPALGEILEAPSG